VIPSPQEFARAQSESLRQELFEKHGYSIHDLGYTRENWATIGLNRVSEALRRESVNHPNFAMHHAEREISLMRRAVEQGDERMLTGLAGENPCSRVSDLLDHQPSFNRAGKDKSLRRQDEPGVHATLEAQQDQPSKEQTFERIDRLKHLFTR
jgi:hypothetical protein